jgi:hypothetical protein
MQPIADSDIGTTRSGWTSQLTGEPSEAATPSPANFPGQLRSRVFPLLGASHTVRDDQWPDRATAILPLIWRGLTGERWNSTYAKRLRRSTPVRTTLTMYLLN